MKKNTFLAFLMLFSLLACNNDDQDQFNEDNQILSFSFLSADNEELLTDVTAVIDETNKTITAEIPFGISLSDLVPTIEVSEDAELNPKSKVAIDFMSDVQYEVTAEDQSTEAYTVSISKAELTDRDVLIDWYNLNPNNTLDWDFSKEISEWDGITVDNGRVVQIDIPEKGLSFMTPLIKHLTQLESLMLFGNEISSLPIQIGDLQNLVALNLTRNHIESLPPEIGNLVNLRFLLLYYNRINVLPTEIGNLENLIQLDLTLNGLKSIPSQIGQLKELQSLSTYGNRQLESIPAEIGNLTQLINLNLGWCNLSTVPGSLGNLTNLIHLRIDENQLQEVPKEIGNLVNLKTLQLQKNRLSQLPLEMGGLDNLLVLFISENQIAELPGELCDLIDQNNVSLDKDAMTSCP